MDALTHAVIGAAVGGFSGHPLDLTDPVYIASILGSQAPDFDILFRLKGTMPYLSQHRGASHSLPGIVFWSGLIAAGLFLWSPSAALWPLFFWSFLGGLTHIALDFCNTHGAAVLWPFNKRRLSCNLLNVFDPALLLLLMSLFTVVLTMRQLASAAVCLILLYLAVRGLLKQRAEVWLKEHFSGKTIETVWLMPCLTHVFYWDFLVRTETSYYLGQIGVFFPDVKVKTELPDETASALADQAKQTATGQFFAEFTPLCYFEECAQESGSTVRVYDLRYYNKMRFIHSGTIVFSDDHTPSHAYIQSYGDRIEMPAD